MLKAWDFVYDKCKCCGQNLQGTGRTVRLYEGRDSLSYGIVERITYKRHPRLSRMEDNFFDFVSDHGNVIWPAAYLSVAVYALFALVKVFK